GRLEGVAGSGAKAAAVMPGIYPINVVSKVECYVCGFAADTKAMPNTCPNCGAARYAFEKEIALTKAWEIAAEAGRKLAILGWEGASPRGRVFALRQYEMRGPLDLLLRRQVKPGEEFARNTWECTGCGACEEVCPVDIPFDGLWDDVKEWMVKSGYERKELEPYLTNVRETHNLFGEPTEARGAWIPPEAVQSANPEVLYWVGCVASYKRQQIARAVVKILNAA